MNKPLIISSIMMAASAFGGITLRAGNIPQYSPGSADATMELITDGTPIRNVADTGTTVIFPDYQGPNDYSGQGFPIGFDFRMGGRYVDQFACASNGALYLGDGEVNFVTKGYGVEPTGTEAFAIHMSPIKSGLSNADISYKTIGTDEEHILIVQYANATLVEQDTQTPGKYNLQFRLHEKDGLIELVFEQLQKPNSTFNGFNTSIKGWDPNDVQVLTAPSLLDQVSVSPFKAAYMLDDESYIHWGREGENFTRKITFTPYLNQTVPGGSPRELSVTQTETTLNIKAIRGRGAAATIILVSDQPITAADLPSDGETFFGSRNTVFGDAHAIYYGNDQAIEVTFDDVEPATTYYIQAISASGYPVYNVDKPAEVTYTTTRRAPELLTAASAGTTTLKVGCLSQCPVIIAATPEVYLGYRTGYIGKFGMPSPDAQVGDEIEGGGKVVFVGMPEDFTYECEPNQMMYFRAWSLDEGRVSATWINAFAIPEVSLPYAPNIQDYPYGAPIYNWSVTPEDEMLPWVREYYRDRALYTVLGLESPITLTSPALPLNVPVNITFEFAMETKRPDAPTPSSGGIPLSQGCKPGVFGPNGYLKVSTGNTVHKYIKEYHGDMVAYGDEGYNDFSSSFETVSFDIPAQKDGDRIVFQMNAAEPSRFFIRNIVVTPLAEAPKAPADAPGMVTVGEDEDGIMTVTCQRGADAAYTLVLFSESPMTEKEEPTDGASYNIGDRIGDAVVLYYGDEDNISCSTSFSYVKDDETKYEYIFAEYDTDYYVRAVSANTNPMYATSNMIDVTYHSNPDPNGEQESIESISASEGRREIFTVTGMRLGNADIKSLPAGLYIINGKKVIKK